MIAVLNGPAVGIGATFLPLCDAVFMSDKATLKTPFGSTAQAPEGCSSYTFPKLLGMHAIIACHYLITNCHSRYYSHFKILQLISGPSLAKKMLMFDHTMSAEEAKACGLVTDVFPHESFDEKVTEKINEIAMYHPNVLQRIKSIVDSHEKDILHSVNEKECQHLVEVWQSEECTRGLEMLLAKITSK